MTYKVTVYHAEGTHFEGQNTEEFLYFQDALRYLARALNKSDALLESSGGVVLKFPRTEGSPQELYSILEDVLKVAEGLKESVSSSIQAKEIELSIVLK